MSRPDESAVGQIVPPEPVIDAPGSSDGGEWADLRPLIDWLRGHRVLAWGVLLIALEIIWKAEFLSHLYFRQDDFHDLDLAIQSPFSWRYLTFIGAGHLIIGLRVVAWLMVRIALYNWTLASAVSLAFVAGASLAALRLLRKLFGDRPAILIPLLFYAICPLTLPDLGEWSSALESVPLQLAIFMALDAHIDYLRSGRNRDLARTAAWVAFGLLFFEKGLVVPPLLFAVTACFLLGRMSLVARVRQALLGYWRAWVLYAAMMAGYLVLLAISLHTSTTKPGVPTSGLAVRTFVEWLLRYSLVPGVVGGPWQWLPAPGSSYSFAAPPAVLVWLALVAVVAVVGVSIWRRRVAIWAWAIMLGWVVLADMLPVAISRLGDFSPAVLGTETRYVADAVPVLAICLGLAFWPIAERGPAAPTARSADRSPAVIAPAVPADRWARGQAPFNAVAALIGLFVFGSLWTAQAYVNVTTGAPAASYISNATQATAQAPRGTPVMDVAVPGDMVEGLFGSFALQSTVIGDTDPGRLHWIRNPRNTIDGLRIFGLNGELYQSYVHGASSVPLPAGKNCWPNRNGAIVVRFAHPSPSYTGILRIGYLWYLSGPGTITVHYGTHTATLQVEPGLHSGYVPVSGSLSKVTIDDVGASLCVGDAQAGNLAPDAHGVILPAAKP